MFRRKEKNQKYKMPMFGILQETSVKKLVVL